MFRFKQELAGTAQVSAGTTNAVVLTVPLATSDIPLIAGRFAEVEVNSYLSRDAPSEAATYVKYFILVEGASPPVIRAATAVCAQDANGGAPSGSGYVINGSGDLDIKVSAGAGGGLGPVYAQVETETTFFGSA